MRCSCDQGATLGICAELNPKGSDDITSYCEALKNSCTDGTYGEEACPTVSLVGTCYNSNADNESWPTTQRDFYYSTGDNPYDATRAEERCVFLGYEFEAVQL